MIYLRLFYNLFLVGLFSIGGGYTAVSLISDLTKKFDSLSPDMISNFIAIAESTPGPIAVNLATYVGTEEAGLIGALVATIAIVLPAFFIILIFEIYFKKIFENKKFTFALSLIRACITGIIAAVGLSMLYKNMYNGSVDYKAIIVMCLLVLLAFIYKKASKKQLSSILIIVFGAILGIAINYLM